MFTIQTEWKRLETNYGFVRRNVHSSDFITVIILNRYDFDCETLNLLIYFLLTVSDSVCFLWQCARPSLK